MSIFSKWFNRSSSSAPKVPKTFKQAKKSLFLNRYAGLIYFMICWHAFGYAIISMAKKTAKEEGVELHQLTNRSKNITKIDIGKNFEIKITESEN